MARIISEPVAGNIDHHFLADLTVGDDHTQYALLAGRATPQQLAFGTASGASTGYLTSTNHATKGKYFLNAAKTIVVNEDTLQIGIGTDSPAAGRMLEVSRNGSNAIRVTNTLTGSFSDLANDGTGGYFEVSNNKPFSMWLGGLERSRMEFDGTLKLLSPTGALLLNRLTTAQRDVLTPINGMIIYNTTLEKFQGYENGVWTNLI